MRIMLGYKNKLQEKKNYLYIFIYYLKIFSF